MSPWVNETEILTMGAFVLVRGREEIEDFVEVCVTRSKYVSSYLSPECSVNSLPLSWAERLLLLSLTTTQIELFFGLFVLYLNDKYHLFPFLFLKG